MSDSSWRVVIVTRILSVAVGFERTLRELGHEPVAVLAVRGSESYVSETALDDLLRGLPKELDVLLAAKRESLAALLASTRPDLVVSMGFPWRVPSGALAVPRLGWLNAHPSMLPRHRGPIPIAWAIRCGEREIGITLHRMDADLDTGAIMAQHIVELPEPPEPEALYARLEPRTREALREALAKLAAGAPGVPQENRGTYESFFTVDDVWLDLARPAEEVHRLVWAWRYAPPAGMRGALLTVDGETVRVEASSLREVDGALRVECGDGPLWLVRIEPVPVRDS